MWERWVVYLLKLSLISNNNIFLKKYSFVSHLSRNNVKNSIIVNCFYDGKLFRISFQGSERSIRKKKKTIRISANDIENIFKNHKSFIQCLLKFIKILI